MKPSTLLELGGFAFLVYAAWQWHVTAGLIAAGVVLLLIGYSFDDKAAAVSLARLVHPLAARRTARKERRRAVKHAKTEG